MVTRYSRELVFKMLARFRYSKSVSTTVLSEITACYELLKINEKHFEK